MLKNFIDRMGKINVINLNRDQQLAYWINLYNAEIIYVILENYPVKSIMKISSNWFSHGPWDQKMIRVDNRSISLNDIEHGIIRPIWNDPRTHAALNCGSWSCPNLQQIPYQGKIVYQQLNKATYEFINSPRAVTVKGDQLELSQIFDWYNVDFNNDEGVKRFILLFADKKLKQEVKATTVVKYQGYDWLLNQES
ncbi:DUF547 domain-containing protein [Piscirickettsia litoralis]|uniref:DUF547 domain-containing protein n=1 Tax=Piscirickettsia litoralis TaxID=1891921 RepID=UPI0011130082|nr:DUF547 domain-containing protein [Piscirickettsia litoralis]